MTRHRTGRDHATADGAHPRGLAASIDEAADDLDANGPVPAEELRRALLGLEAEWVGKKNRPPRTRPGD